MDDVSESAYLATGCRLLTAADLALLPTQLPSGDVDYELDRGRLIVKRPPCTDHASLEILIAAELMRQGQRQGHGRGFTNVGIVLARNPDTVLAADLAFVAKAKLPLRKSREDYLETIPDLVIEVRSKNDTRAERERKAEQYLSAGVGIVLIVDPEARLVAEHRTGIEPRIYRAPETLALDEPITGFRVDLGECFSECMV
jgi:Uma2 family endonuclease